MDSRLSRRLETFLALITATVAAPARVLEIGCGGGELARALADAGYEVIAIDPDAPEGPIFRRESIEEFSGDSPFDAVVASLSLHHVHDVELAFEKVAAALRPGGALVVDEFAKERFAGATAAWYFHQRLALQVIGKDERPIPDEFDAWYEAWTEKHAHIHPSDVLRRQFDARFEQQDFTWGPYLYDYWLDDALEPFERELIEAGKIEAIGFRYVGRA
jgi:SAM-dependent methyltransferase